MHLQQTSWPLSKSAMGSSGNSLCIFTMFMYSIGYFDTFKFRYFYFYLVQYAGPHCA